jgi:hypothetical protein
MNFTAFLVAALIPMVVGSIYYHKNVVGKAWMSASGMTEEKATSGNMVVTLIASYVFSFFLAFILGQIVNHQSGLYSLFADDLTNPLFKQVMDAKSGNFRSFGHGALHGFMTTVCIALPIIGMNALFEQRGWKYIGIHIGYWAISLMLMGGVICAWI